MTGIFVETDDPLPAHQTYTIHFTVPIPRRDIRAEARITKVVTVKDREKLGLFSGMALEFLNLDLEDRKYIEEYVDKSTSIRKRTLGRKEPQDIVSYDRRRPPVSSKSVLPVAVRRHCSTNRQSESPEIHILIDDKLQRRPLGQRSGIDVKRIVPRHHDLVLEPGLPRHCDVKLFPAFGVTHVSR